MLFLLNAIPIPMEQTSVERIYHRYKKLIKYLAISKLSDETQAEDVLQEVMLRVILHCKKLESRPEEQVKAFIYLVTRSVIVDELRHENRHPTAPLEEVVHCLPAEDRLWEHLDTEPLVQAIARLPDAYRDVLELTAYYGFTLREAAGILKISYAAARKRLERARGMLRSVKGE